MIRKLLVAGLLMLGVALLTGRTDRLDLLAGGLGALAILGGLALFSILRRRRDVEEIDGGFDDADLGSTNSVLRDGLAGLLIGALGLVLASAAYRYALPPFYPFLVGDCPQLLPKLAIYEEAAAWPRAVELIDARLSRPLDAGCRGELAARKCRYLIEWSKQLPPDQAERKLLEAEQWAAANNLPDYRTIAQLMRSQLQPTPTPQMVTPTPSPTPVPRSLPAGATAHLTGIDLAFFPPTVFAYLRVLDAAGQPIADLSATDMRVFDDGRPVEGFSVSQFSKAPAQVWAALVIDYSGSMSGEPLASAKAGAKAFLDLFGPNDRMEVIGFSDRAQVLQAWTGDRNAAAQALELLPAQGWTALWDALWLASSDLAGCPGRKVIVLLTDGADNRSQHTREEAIGQARRAGVSLFVIGLRSEEYSGAAMQSLVEAVGGRYSEASNAGELEAYYRQVAGAIRSEYRLALTLSRPRDGGQHRLRVEIGGPQPLVAEQAYQDPGQ